jgi:transposase
MVAFRKIIVFGNLRNREIAKIAGVSLKSLYLDGSTIPEPFNP